MNRPLRLWILLAFFLFLAAPPGGAQVPKVGGWFEDETDVGFRIKMPKDWSFVPPSPEEPNLVGRYEHATNKYAVIGGGLRLPIVAYLVKFDATDAPGDLSPEKLAQLSARDRVRLLNWKKDLDAWLPGNFRINGAGPLSRVSEKAVKVGKVQATEYVYAADFGETAYNVYAMVYDLGPDLQVAAVFNGPGESKWRKYETVFKKMAKSFKPMKIEKVDVSSISDSDSALRSKKKAELLDAVSRAPGWELIETPNYFILSNSEDRDFVKEIEKRLEAIRAQYEGLFPPDELAELRAQAPEPPPEEVEGAEGQEEAPPPRTVAKDMASSWERSRTSVVRVCKNQGDYFSYGGPPGSAGYWYALTEELVIFDDKASGGRRDTWSTLNHEAFHQYIYYVLGQLSPHYWYNEGNADYFAGYEYRNGRYKTGPFAWRTGIIKEAVRTGTHTPLKEFVEYDRSKYYDPGTRSLNYAQGWALVYFLRTGKKGARGWNSVWDPILDTYVETLAATADLKQANAAAFAGVDWDELEKAWIKYTE